ncbi:MAG: aminoacyl-tRNA hydrolase [Mariprofundaceae bacterium]
MRLIVGLGNPGSKYESTRHNVGFRFLDLLAESEGLRFDAAPRFHAEIAAWKHSGEKNLLIKPQTFMNNSGESVGALARYYDVESKRIIVVYDDLDLPAGKVRLKKGGGHGGHNGLKSLNQHLPDHDYVRIKVGIGRPEHGDITPWVLGKASEGDRAFENSIFAALLAEWDTILEGDLALAANHIHLKLQS